MKSSFNRERLHVLHCASLVTQSCLTLWDPMDYSPPDSSVHGILQARVLERVAMPSSRGSSQPRDWIQVSCIAGRFFPFWACMPIISAVITHLPSWSQLFSMYNCLKEGFLGGASGKEPTCQCRRHRRHGFNPWAGKISRRAWQPTPVFLPGEFHGWRSLVNYGPRCRQESDTSEATLHTCTTAPKSIAEVSSFAHHGRSRENQNLFVNLAKAYSPLPLCLLLVLPWFKTARFLIGQWNLFLLTQLEALQ